MTIPKEDLVEIKRVCEDMCNHTQKDYPNLSSIFAIVIAILIEMIDEEKTHTLDNFIRYCHIFLKEELNKKDAHNKNMPVQ